MSTPFEFLESETCLQSGRIGCIGNDCFSRSQDDADYFEEEIEEEKRDEKNIHADEDVPINRVCEIGAQEESVSDDGDIDEDVQEVCDAPDCERNHGFDPAREDEYGETVEREDAEREREGIEFIGPEGDENIGKSWFDEGVEEETCAMQECEKKRLEGERMVNREGVDRTQYFFQYRETNGNAQENNDPREGESDESRSASDIPDPRSLNGLGVKCDRCHRRGSRGVEGIGFGKDFRAIVPAVTITVGIFRIRFEKGCFSDIGESVEIGIDDEAIGIRKC